MERLLRIVIVATGTVTFCLLLGWFLAGLMPRESEAHDGSLARLGNVQNLRTAYSHWKANQLAKGDQNLVVALGWSKALSAEFTKANGSATLDLTSGSISIQVRGLRDQGISDVWLVDNLPGDDTRA